ncbi:phosphotransferase [Methylomonas sp. MgM2]
MIEIACLEPNEFQRNGVIDGVRKLFETCELPVNVYAVKTSDEVVKAAQNGRLDVFVCDLSLNTGDPLGLGLISDVKSQCPGLFTIAITSGDWNISEVEKLPFRYDLFIPKMSIFGKGFTNNPNYVERLFQSFRFSHVRTFNFCTDIKPINDVPPPERNEFLDLIRQTISYHPPFHPSSLISDVELEQLGGGRSTSYVFELKAKMGSDGRKALPVVLKLSKINDWREELNRYEVFVKWTLPHQMRVDIIGHGKSVDWGAIAYSFAHGETGLSTLTDLLKAGNFIECKSIIQNLFNGPHTFWIRTYKDVQYSSLAERYFERFYKKDAAWFEEDKQKLHIFLRDNMPQLKEDNTTWILLGKKLESWPKFLQTKLAESKLEGTKLWSIVHGDLNPNNVIISPDGNLALIDFRDTGIGHCYEDLITLEASVRLNWPWIKRIKTNDSISKLWAIENKIAANTEINNSDDQAWQLIGHIRSIGSNLFNSPLGADYFYGLSYYCFRLLRIATLNDHIKRRIIICGLVAAQTSDILFEVSSRK